mgnify:CR=1 FL=1|jgi:hypothetical protein
MNMEVLIKYLTWVAFFVIVLLGLYALFKSIGIL